MTPYPEVDQLIDHLLKNARRIIGAGLIGFYLDGSLSYGTFDEASDIDFVCVTECPISPAQFNLLHQSHKAISQLPHDLAIQIEGFYVSRQQVKKHRDPIPQVPNIERGPTEELKWVPLTQVWNVHRQYLRQGGIALYGPPAASLIDPLSGDDLRAAMSTWNDWLPSLLKNPSQVKSRGYQSYIVLTVARIMYTMSTAELASKPAAIAWLRDHSDGRYDALLEDAWAGRIAPNTPISPGALSATIGIIQDYLLSIK